MNSIFKLIAQKLNLNKSHNFKVRDIQLAIPKESIPTTERKFLENFCACGYVYEKAQEAFEKFIRLLEKILK